MVSSPSIEDLRTTARQIRRRVIQLSHSGKAPHLGSSLSCVDILVAAYWSALRIDPQNPYDPDRDRFILSKGHAASALYSTLATRGFFPLEQLDTFNQNGSQLPEQPAPNLVPGIEAATGSLGHGLSLGLGMALSARIQKRTHRVFVVLSDGECNEGSVWEAALFAGANGLENVMAIIDYNRWQATGRSNEVMALSPLKDKWAAFGWDASEIDGHDLRALTDAMNQLPNKSGKPVALVAHTTKGKGVSFMEDDNNWHYRIPSEEELRAAMAELER